MTALRQSTLLLTCALIAIGVSGRGLAQSTSDSPDEGDRSAVQSVRPKPVIKVIPSDPPPVSDQPGWAPDQTPADFLDGIGSRIKARWRQHYRQEPTVAGNERSKAAFVLGSLVGDGFLALQANDAQQFRNNTQDVLACSRTLGLGEKLSPHLMSQAKMAEAAQWPELRQQVVDGHQELCRLLREQKDDDLAVLVDLGVWLRLMQVVSSIVLENAEASEFKLCVGAAPLVKDIQARFLSISPATREVERIKHLGELIDSISRHWLVSPLPADLERVRKTQEKLTEIMTKLTLR